MKTYEIPIAWQSIKTYTIEANSLQEAAEKALNEFFGEPDENYIEDSFEVDGVVEDNYPDEEINYKKLL